MEDINNAQASDQDGLDLLPKVRFFEPVYTRINGSITRSAIGSSTSDGNYLGIVNEPQLLRFDKELDRSTS
jgi:hypothetical protein